MTVPTPTQPEASRPRLVLLNTDLKGRQFVLGPGVTTIGRGQDCSIQLDFASISRTHARIEETNGRFLAVDLGSRNGIRIGEQRIATAELRHGDVLGVGQVLLRFESPSAAQARPLTGTDIVAAARQGGLASSTAQAGAPHNLPAADGTGPRVGLNLKMILLVALAAAFSITLGIGLIKFFSARSASGVATLAPQLIRVRENKWVPLGRLGSFAQGDIRIEDEGIVDIAKTDGNSELVMTGLSGGSTTVRIHGSRGTGEIRVLVRGRLDDPLDELTYSRLSDEQRYATAKDFIQSARTFESEQRPYRALREYEKTAAVLKPLDQGDLYREAKLGITRTATAVDKRWDTLRSSIRVALSNRDYQRANELITEVLVLIPEPNDWRYQKVMSAQQQILRTEDASRRAGKRGSK